MSFVPTSPQLFFSKNDPEDPRLGDHFKIHPAEFSHFSPNDFAVFGYPDDEGIKMNGGRPGAHEAPKTIRRFLYKMTWPLREKTSQNFYDLGDLKESESIEKKHAEALKFTTSLHQQKVKTVSFGGGHDYGYPDTAGFVKNYLNSKERPLVINFDAHLDVRPMNQGPNSGTSFHRLLSEFGEQIDFVEIGLQPQCNSVFHRDWALKKKAFLFDLETVRGEKLLQLFEKAPFTRLNRETPVFVSFDIDALSSSEAGGCSQSWVTGLYIQNCLDFLTQLYQKSNCRGLGIYEVSPPLDTDFRTSKTAALLAYNFIFQS